MTEFDELENSGQTDNRRKAVFGIVLLGIVIAGAATLPVTQWLEFAARWIEANPMPGRFMFLGGFVVLTALMVPGSVLMLTGGYLFGMKLGLPLVSIGVTVGALASSFVSRTLARDWLSQRFANDARFLAIDRAVARKGFLIVFLSRLSLLIPYNLLNLIYGLSGISLTTMTLATWLGMLPAVLLYTYLGSIAGNFSELVANDGNNGLQQLALAFGVIMVVVVTLVIHRAATRELKKELEAQAD